jgi:hypothetical protein
MKQQVKAKRLRLITRLKMVVTDEKKEGNSRRETSRCTTTRGNQIHLDYRRSIRALFEVI